MTFNLVNVATINCLIAKVMPADTSLTQLGTTPASNHIWKINSIMCSNVTAVPAAVTLSIYPNTTPTGTPTRIAYQIVVPGNATLIVIDKSTSFYLPESYSIGVTSSIGAAIEYTLSYEDLS